MKKLTVAESISQSNKTTVYLDMKLYYMLQSITCHTRDLHLFHCNFNFNCIFQYKIIKLNRTFYHGLVNI